MKYCCGSGTGTVHLSPLFISISRTGTWTTAVALGHVSPLFISISRHWNMIYCCGSGTRVTPFHINITTLEHDLLPWLWDTCNPFSYQYHDTGTWSIAVALGHAQCGSVTFFIAISRHWNNNETSALWVSAVKSMIFINKNYCFGETLLASGVWPLSRRKRECVLSARVLVVRPLVSQNCLPGARTQIEGFWK